MTKKSLGYVELEWTCPNCGSRNPGHVKVCQNCGAAQPADVSFQQPAQEAIITDAEVIEKAKLGPDIHCAFCGTRNPADAETCANCGASLDEGTQREAGNVLGAHRDDEADPVKCHYCGTMNEAEALQCKNCGATLQIEKPEKPEPRPTPQTRSSSSGINRWILIGGGVLLVIACIAAFIFINRTDDVTGQVSNVSWERQIVILGLAPVSREAWQDELPQGVEVGTCREEFRYTSDNPEPNSVEVCGTPYSVDTGSGFAEVVQDCEYQVYDNMCQFTALELLPVDTQALSGSDLDPRWPTLNLEPDQQEGEREETYRIVFSADGERYTYTTRDPQEYANFDLGSIWTLKVNQLGGVVEVEPGR